MDSCLDSESGIKSTCLVLQIGLPAISLCLLKPPLLICCENVDGNEPAIMYHWVRANDQIPTKQ